MNQDPKKEAGDKKDPLHLLPTIALRETAHVLKLGADKYGIYNWRKSDGLKTSTYIGAMLRHLTQFMDGENMDAESGRSHLAHIMATCCVLLDADKVGRLIDDRPIIDDKTTLVPVKVTTWKPPCWNTPMRIHCDYAAHPVVCGSCVDRPEGRTNYKPKNSTTTQIQ